MSESTNPARDSPLPESRFSVLLVEPQFRDNVGHAARSMLPAVHFVAWRTPPLARERRPRSRASVSRASRASRLATGSPYDFVTDPSGLYRPGGFAPWTPGPIDLLLEARW